MGLFHPFPTPAVYDIADRADMRAVASGEFRNRRSQSSRNANVCDSFSSKAPRAAWVQPFVKAVMGIGGVISKKQVARVNASLDVARVANVQTARCASEVNSPRQAMSIDIVGANAGSYNAIPSRSGCGPQPTISGVFGLANLLPESVQQRSSRRHRAIICRVEKWSDS